MPRHSLVILGLFSSAFLAVACGSGGSTSSSTTTSTTTTTAGSGGSGGGSTTSGSGGAGGGATTSGSGGSGGAGMGACTNAADLAIVMSKDVAGITGKCGQDNLGGEPKTKECIKAGTGLSDACVDCFDGTVQCVVMKCFSECVADATSQMCVDCRKANCDPAFEACSGLPAAN
ncbi:MAG: hypothetical protein U0359_13605 [Byssovorax sp.]